MATAPRNPIKEIRTELYRPDNKWYEFWKPKRHRLFIVYYEDGSGKVYKTKDNA